MALISTRNIARGGTTTHTSTHSATRSSTRSGTHSSSETQSRSRQTTTASPNETTTMTRGQKITVDAVGATTSTEIYQEDISVEFMFEVPVEGTVYSTSGVPS